MELLSRGIPFQTDSKHKLAGVQSNEYKYEIERLTLDLNDMKRRHFSQKRKEIFRGKAEDKMALPAIANPSQTRFTGGGFSLATQPA